MSTESQAEQEQPGEPLDVLPASNTSPDLSTKKTDVPSKRFPGRMIVEEALSMFAHVPMRDPLLDKMGPKQIDRTLEIQATRETNYHQLRMANQKTSEAFSTKLLVFGSFVLVAVLVLFWLFLHYGKTEQVFNLIAILATGGGGVGIGVGLKGKGILAAPSPSSD